MLRRLLYITIFVYLGNSSYAQNMNNLSDTVYHLYNFMISNKFEMLGDKKNDIEKVDILYREALIINDFNYSEALLTLTFATLAFKEMRLKIPFLSLILILPLPSPNYELFRQKLDVTPRYLFFDSDFNKSGDVDKISHFFGNAFLSYNISWFNLSEFLGLFVETFEMEFKIDGNIDERDILVNKLGNEFGKSLDTNKDILPSQFLIFYDLMNVRFYN